MPDLQSPAAPASKEPSRFLARPASRLGWWALALAAVSIFAIATLVSGAFKHAATHTPMKICGLIMVLSGLAAGVTGLLAIIRHSERSWLVILPLLVGVFFLLLVIAEIIWP